MVSKSIMGLALEAGFAFEEQDNLFVVDPDGVCKFAELVRADERESILGLVDSYAKNNTDLAAAIRARGNP